MKNQEAVLAVKFRSSLDGENLLTICDENLEDFRDVPGLIKKYYLQEETSGAISGFYVFATKSAREAFWTSELAKNIPVKYGVIPESLRVERYDVAILLETVLV